MSKLIDADKLIAEIQRRKKQDTTIRERSILIDIETAIDSLQQEQPEVDLEKEYKIWWNSISDKINVEHIMEWYMHETARHFAEWGAIHLNTRKEE